MPALTGAVAPRFPVAGLVASARVSFRIGERFGQERAVAKALRPVFGQDAQRRAQGLRRQIGRWAFAGQQQKAAVLHHPFQTFHALAGAPENPAVAIFERVAGRPPDQQGDRLAGAFDDVAQVIADRLPAPK